LVSLTDGKLQNQLMKIKTKYLVVKLIFILNLVYSVANVVKIVEGVNLKPF